MQKFLLSGLTALAVLCASVTDAEAAVQNSLVRTKAASSMTVNHVLKGNETKNYLSAPTRASESDVTITPKVTQENRDEFLFIGAVRTVDGVSEIYGGEVFEGEADAFTVPSGTYTFFAYGLKRRLAGSILIIKKDLVVEEGFTLAFSTAEATTNIELKQICPSGEQVKTDYDVDFCISIAEDVITYDGEVAFWSGVDLYSDQMNYIATNVAENVPGLEFTRLHVAPSVDYGMLFSVLPVDFTKPENATTTEGWAFADYTIVDTPAKLRDMELWREAGVPEEEIPYTFLMYFVTFDNKVRATAGVGETGPINAGKIGFWQPVGYEGKINQVVLPAGSVIAGHDSSIKCMPVTYVQGEGIVQLGYNPAFEPNFIYTAEGRTFGHGNPLYNVEPAPAVIGNCTPALVTVPYGGEISFTFTGRHGESFDIDSWYKESYTNAEALGFTNQVTVAVNGETVCANRAEYPDKVNWSEAGEFKLTFSTDNVLIDNEIKGLASGTLTYNTETYNKLIPTVTFMQFVGADGKITDRFASPDDATMVLYASVVKYNRTSGSMSNRYVYYDFNAPADVKVEWAPGGTAEFSELTAVADTSKDYAPGFGSYYSVDMSDINVPGWIDVRITVTAESGAQQVQTVHPALYVQSTTGIADVIGEDNNVAPRYYNLQGMQINQPAAGQLVIRRQGNTTTKIIME